MKTFEYTTEISENGKPSHKKTFKFIDLNPDYCLIRKDLREENLGVPLWEVEGKEFWVSGNTKREYRWLKDTSGFQVKYRNKWYNAYSIDFDFE